MYLIQIDIFMDELVDVSILNLFEKQWTENRFDFRHVSLEMSSLLCDSLINYLINWLRMQTEDRWKYIRLSSLQILTISELIGLVISFPVATANAI